MLDTAIRDWVLIPLSVVMVLIGVLRYFVSKLMRSSQIPDAKIVKEGYFIPCQMINYADMLILSLILGWFCCDVIQAGDASSSEFTCKC